MLVYAYTVMNYMTVTRFNIYSCRNVVFFRKKKLKCERSKLHPVYRNMDAIATEAPVGQRLQGPA